MNEHEKTTPDHSIPPLDEIIDLTDPEIQAKLLEAHKDVRVDFRYPLLKQKPVLRRAKNDPRASMLRSITSHINIVTHAQTLYREYLSQLVGAGADLEAVLRGNQAHEIGHYATFPKNLATSLIVHKEAESKWPIETYGSFYSTVYGLYSDVVDDLYNIVDHRRRDYSIEEVVHLAKLEQGSSRRLRHMMLGVYEHFAHSEEVGADYVDFGLNLSRDAELRQKVNELVKIDYFAENPIQHAVNIRLFGRIILDNVIQDSPGPTVVCPHYAKDFEDMINEKKEQQDMVAKAQNDYDEAADKDLDELTDEQKSNLFFVQGQNYGWSEGWIAGSNKKKTEVNSSADFNDAIEGLDDLSLKITPAITIENVQDFLRGYDAGFPGGFNHGYTR